MKTPRRIIHDFRIAAFVSLTLFTPSLGLAVPGRLTSFQTTNIGTETLLTSVQLDDARGSVPIGQLIGIELVHYATTLSTTTSGMTVVALSPNTAAQIDENGRDRADLLDVDAALNSGIINIQPGSGVGFGNSPGSGLFGIGIHFDSPVVNGPGDDLVFFDFGSFQNPNPDGFTITGLDSSGLSVGFTTVIVADYFATLNFATVPFPDGLLATKTFFLNNPLASLDNLEDAIINSSSNVTQPRVAAGSFDLSRLGIARNEVITEISGLFIQSTIPAATFDPVFIAGLRPVPEPSAGTMIISALSIFGFRHRWARHSAHRLQGPQAHG